MTWDCGCASARQLRAHAPLFAEERARQSPFTLICRHLFAEERAHVMAHLIGGGGGGREAFSLSRGGGGGKHIYLPKKGLMSWLTSSLYTFHILPGPPPPTPRAAHPTGPAGRTHARPPASVRPRRPAAARVRAARRDPASGGKRSLTRTAAAAAGKHSLSRAAAAAAHQPARTPTRS